MKIALLHPTTSIAGGAEKQVLYLARHLREMGNEVKLFTLWEDESKDHFKDLKREIPLETTSSTRINPSRILDFAPMAKKIVAQIERERYELVNYHNYPMLLARRYFEGSSAGHVWMCNESPFPYSGGIPNFLGIVRDRSVDRLAEAVTENEISWRITAPLFFKQLLREKIDRTVVLDNRTGRKLSSMGLADPIIVRTGVDFDYLQGGDTRAVRDAYGLGGKKVLLVVSALQEPHKRVEDAIESLAMVSKLEDDIVLIVVGIGRLMNRYMALAAKMRLADRVIFTGYVPESRLRDFYAASDILIFPPHHQTWGLACFEAMAVGKPVVASRDTGAAEVIGSNNLGILVSPKRPFQIAAAIENLLEDQALYQRLSTDGQKFVALNLSWRRYAESMLRIFRSVLTRKGLTRT